MARVYAKMVGMNKVSQRLRQVQADFIRRLDEKLTELAYLVIEDAKKLAPLDTGDLEASLVVGDIKQQIGLRFIEMGNSPETNDYAVIMHEAFYRPGPKTASKGMHKGHAPGRKYLENALKLNEPIIDRELKKILGG
jgi:hypothetical protein